MVRLGSKWQKVKKRPSLLHKSMGIRCSWAVKWEKINEKVKKFQSGKTKKQTCFSDQRRWKGFEACACLDHSVSWWQFHKTLFPSSLKMRPNKLEVTLGNPFQLGLRIWGQGQSKPDSRTYQMLPSWVSSWCYQQMLDKTGKFLPGAKTLAYLALSSATKTKSFITLTPGDNFTKLFFLHHRCCDEVS